MEIVRRAAERVLESQSSELKDLKGLFSGVDSIDSIDTAGQPDAVSGFVQVPRTPFARDLLGWIGGSLFASSKVSLTIAADGLFVLIPAVRVHSCIGVIFLVMC